MAHFDLKRMIVELDAEESQDDVSMAVPDGFAVDWDTLYQRARSDVLLARIVRLIPEE